MTELALQLALTIAKRFEGCRLRPYLCPAGVPTIGYGTTRYLDGTAVTLSDPPINAIIALGLLQGYIERVCIPLAITLCPTINTPGRLAAIADFIYNLGPGRLKASTLRRRILAGAWDDVPAELRKWVMANGRRLQGLILRREAEILLVSSGS